MCMFNVQCDNVGRVPAWRGTQSAEKGENHRHFVVACTQECHYVWHYCNIQCHTVISEVGQNSPRSGLACLNCWFLAFQICVHHLFDHSHRLLLAFCLKNSFFWAGESKDLGRLPKNPSLPRLWISLFCGAMVLVAGSQKVYKHYSELIYRPDY